MLRHTLLAVGFAAIGLGIFWSVQWAESLGMGLVVIVLLWLVLAGSRSG